MKQCFPSKRGVFYGVFLWGTLLTITGMIAKHLISDFDLLTVLIFVPLATGLFIWIGIFWFKIRYYIEDQLLTIKVGTIHFIDIDVGKIRTIERIYSPLNSAATAIKRLRIKHRGGAISISPINEDKFIRKLKSINSSIEVSV